MTLENIVREVSYGCKSAQTQQDLKGFVNRAIRTIAERWDWRFLFDHRQVTIASGYNYAPLGEDFKKLADEGSPIAFQYGSYNLSVFVTSRSRIEMAGIYPFPNGPLSFPVPGGNLPVRVVFLEWKPGINQYVLEIPNQFQITQPAAFFIQAYFYPAELVKADDENGFTRDGNLLNAVINTAKSYAYRADDNTDARGDAAKAQAEEAIVRAMYSDSAISMAGRSLRM